MNVRRLFLVPPAAAVVIGALVAWRSLRAPAPAVDFAVEPGTGRMAPLFKLHDENSEIIRLERHIGREKLLLVFFDGSRGPEGSELLSKLRTGFAAIRNTGAIVLGISDLRPAELRPPLDSRGERTQRAEPFPFRMLSDVNDHEVHRLYGAFDEDSGKPHEAVIVVDRAGVIRRAHFGPGNLGTPAQWAAELNQVK